MRKVHSHHNVEPCPAVGWLLRLAGYALLLIFMNSALDGVNSIVAADRDKRRPGPRTNVTCLHFRPSQAQDIGRFAWCPFLSCPGGAAMLRRLLLSLSLVAFSFSTALAEDLPIVSGVEAQPLKAQAERMAQALDYLGEPLTKEQKSALDKAIANTKGDEAVEAIQKILDKRCLAGVNINPESRVKVARGPAAAELVEQG
jgi:hypothetical protein